MNLNLTKREIQVVLLLCEGFSSSQVAKHLQISVNTAETHRSNILRKLGFDNTILLVRWAIRKNLIAA